MNNQLKWKKKHIEHVMPKVHENVLIEKSHVHEKISPQFFSNEFKQQFIGDVYYGSNQDMNAMGQTRQMGQMGQMGMDQMNQGYNNNNNNNMNTNMNMSGGSSNYGYGSGSGEFIITIVSAQSSKKNDLLSKADPYVVVKTHDQTLKTKTVKNTTTPVWNEEFRIGVTDDIEILMMDDDILKDDQMGRAILSRDRLMNIGMNGEEIQLPITMKGKEVGVIFIRVRQLDQQSHQHGSSHMPSSSYSTGMSSNSAHHGHGQSQGQVQGHGHSHSHAVNQV
jgi:hypothetical protein